LTDAAPVFYESRMFHGSRVTDVTQYLGQRGEVNRAVRVVRERTPERFRWRSAVASVSALARDLRGRDRMRIEEPIREVVLDLDDELLRREVVLDARKVGVDLDRGEVLPRYTMGQLVQLSIDHSVELGHLARYTKLPSDSFAPIDTAACVVVGRLLAEHHRQRAHRLWLSVPDPDGPDAIKPHERYILERASRDRLTSEHWAKIARTLLGA
jgi:hypothetical protein